MGAEVILIPAANLTSEWGEMFLWELRVQAMQNSVYIAMCNRVGIQDNIEFCGESVIVDYRGSIAHIANIPQAIVSEIFPEYASQNRHELPYFTSRIPDKYFI